MTALAPSDLAIDGLFAGLEDHSPEAVARRIKLNDRILCREDDLKIDADGKVVKREESEC